MAGLHDLSREYEARRFPPTRRLDLHGEGPHTARERALHWIQSFAHEEPGAELLLIVERVVRPGRPASPVRQAVEALLEELRGGLIDWYQYFGSGSVAVRVAAIPRMTRIGTSEAEESPAEGRTPDTAGVALLALHHDIPQELLGVARRAAELKRVREGISVGLLGVVLRRIWIQTQAIAMEERIPFSRALDRILREEQARVLEEE